jgi:23S rRNA pseudouridine1911/1915/1917 synthase
MPALVTETTRPPEGARPMIELRVSVGATGHGLRLDRFLCAQIPRLSRTRVQAIVRSGQGRRLGADAPMLRGAARVYEGQVLILTRPAKAEPPVVMDYQLLHRDPGLFVLNKPAGLPVHPSARYHLGTLTALLRTRLGPEHGWELAHRLDRETSGVLVLGRRRGTAATLKRAFRERAITKIYWAVVHGRVAHARVIDTPLGPAIDSRVRIKIGPRPLGLGGRAAYTEITPRAHATFRGAPITLVEVRPRTGRQHQIRVHLAEIGHGVVGDKLYGLDERRFLEVVEDGRPAAALEAELGLARHALHARELALTHPTSALALRFTAPWPDELAELIAPPRD